MCWRICNRTECSGGERGERERGESEEERPNIVRPHLRLETTHNPPPLSCYLLQLGKILEWTQHAGDFSDESKIYGRKRFEPKYPTSKEDLLALTALRLNDCNISGNQNGERDKYARLVFRLQLHSESVKNCFNWEHKHCLLSHPSHEVASSFYNSFFSNRSNSRITRELYQT